MKLQSLRVNQLKMFMEPHCINKVADGLNVIAGPNEIGKSTMFDALRAVLFETYSAGGQRIEALRNDRSRGAPLIHLVFEHDNGKYVLTKRFLGQAFVKLVCPGGVVLEGPEAEERLRTLFRFSHAPRGGASAESMRVWDVLWVKQGDSISNPALSESGRATLSDIVQSAAVDIIGGRQGREILKELTEQHDKLHTATHRPKTGGDLKKAIDEADELKQTLKDVESRRDQAEQDLEGLNTTEDALRQLDAGNPDLADRTKLTQRENALQQVKDSAGDLTTAKTERENRKLQLDNARHKRNERSEARTALSDESADLEAERIELAERQKALEAEQKQINLREAAAVLALEKRMRDAEAAQSRVNEAAGEVASILATDERYRRVEDAETGIFRIEEQLGAAATKITFEIEDVRQSAVQIDKRPLSDVLRDETQPLEQVEPIEITIAGIGRILIDPNVLNGAELLQARQQAVEERRNALETAGADSVEDARQKNRQRREHAEQESDARSELATLAQDGVKALRQQVDDQRRHLTDLPSETWAQASEMAPDNDDLTRRKVRKGKLQESIVSLEKTTANLLASVQSKGNEISQAKQQASDAQLESNLKAAEQAFNVADEKYQTLSAQRPELDREQLEDEISGLKGEMDDRRDKRNNLKSEIAVLRDHINRDEAAGIHEQVGNAENEIEQATRDVARLEREVAVLDLLVETLTAAENDAKDQYLEPVLQKVLPYIQKLFPTAEIAIDNTLNVTAVTRNPSYQEPFANLSLGTQEQIAVIVRLALAKLLAEQGVPAVVVLDDALIYSDDDRMRLMFDILIEAARDIQILVFTCREQLFEGLNAHRFNITPCDHEGHSVA